MKDPVTLQILAISFFFFSWLAFRRWAYLRESADSRKFLRLVETLLVSRR